MESVTVNGTDLDPAEHYSDSRVRLPGLAAENVVVVAATGRYTNTGEGLHRFVDPVDDEVYLYSQFEVPDSRRMYPVFEQPDLKARFAFTVTAPAHWQVVSNSPTPQPEPAARGSVATWHFAPTGPISSYITALVAGPYDVVRDTVTSRRGEVPLGIFCRRSLTPYLDADNLFDLTKRGFAFFEDEFDHAYPFEKYDQIFTPEYNAGAMENAAAVTINEMYVFRSKVTESLVERRALTVLHELAHMWFGNLVTMRWWNDLWLNESFAEWASTTCQSEATTGPTPGRPSAPTRRTGPTARTSSARPTRSSPRSTTWRTSRSTSTASPTPRAPRCSSSWWPTSGASRSATASAPTSPSTPGATPPSTTCSASSRPPPVATCAPGRASGSRPPGSAPCAPSSRSTTAATSRRRPSSRPAPRASRRCARTPWSSGVYAVRDGALHRTDHLELDVEGARTPVPELVGREQPDLLLVNDDDLAYAKIRLDERSLATALAHPRGFTSSLPRSLVLASLWDMTRDAEMGARHFVDVVLETLPGETDSTLLRTLFTQLLTAVNSYTAPEHRAAVRTATRDRLWEIAVAAEPGSDAQLQLVSATAALTASGDDTARLRALLDGTETLEGLRVDFEMRWTLLTALVAAGAADAAEIDAERAREDTATGRERAARARAARPTAEAKEEAWAAAVEGNLPNAVVDAVALGFTRPGTPAELLRPFVERYHALLDTVEERGSHAMVEAIVSGFYPRPLADRELLERTQAWLDASPHAHAALRRLVVENRDPVVRALAAQERDARD